MCYGWDWVFGIYITSLEPWVIFPFFTPMTSKRYPLWLRRLSLVSRIMTGSIAHWGAGICECTYTQERYNMLVGDHGRLLMATKFSKTSLTTFLRVLQLDPRMQSYWLFVAGSVYFRPLDRNRCKMKLEPLFCSLIEGKNSLCNTFSTKDVSPYLLAKSTKLEYPYTSPIQN